jgi:hypothetical protein
VEPFARLDLHQVERAAATPGLGQRLTKLNELGANSRREPALRPLENQVGRSNALVWLEPLRNELPLVEVNVSEFRQRPHGLGRLPG